MSRPLRKKILAHLQGNAPDSKLQQRRRRRESLSAWSSMVFVFIVLTICVSPNLFQTMPTPPAGSTWNYPDVVTPYELKLPDPEAEQLQKLRIQENHVKVFDYNNYLEVRAVNNLREMLAYTRQVAGSTTRPEILQQHIQEKWGASLQNETVATIMQHAGTSRTLSDLETIFHHMFDVRKISDDKSLLIAAMRSNRALVLAADNGMITSSSLRQVLGYPQEAFTYLGDAYLTTFQVSSNLRSAYFDISRQFLKPNVVYDREDTERRREMSLAQVKAVRTLAPGSVVVKQNEVVSNTAAYALQELSDRERMNDLLRLMGDAIIVLLAMAFTTIYAGRFNRDLAFNARSVLMVALPVVFAVSLGRVILNIGGGFLLGAFAMPAGMVGILTVMLFDERFALVLTTMACALFAVSTASVFPYTLIGMVGGYTAIASLRNLQERREVLFTGIYVALANCVMALAISLILSPSNPDLQAGLIAALVNGLVCYILAVGALPVFESTFQITTDVLLLELTGANHKLLQMMEEKAPGSLYHSMNVAGLAEAAAEAVGAHYLLVRAGAYFHDIGKMLKPTYFTENQSTPEQKQIHSRLSPAMSTLIIKNHVKEGVELARSHRLPERVIDFIPEHHGTSLIKFFYVQAIKKAAQEGSDEIISEEEYRYPGPKPRSVETAILMLADSVEAIATSRFSGKMPDETDIRRAVHEAVTEKYEDRQLNNSPLTFQDLEIIKEAFVRVLQNRFHQRVKYPTIPSARGVSNVGVTTKPVSTRKLESAAVNVVEMPTKK